MDRRWTHRVLHQTNFCNFFYNIVLCLAFQLSGSHKYYDPLLLFRCLPSNNIKHSCSVGRVELLSEDLAIVPLLHHPLLKVVPLEQIFNNRELGEVICDYLDFR